MKNRAIKNLRWCSNCLTMSTRPRITFDDNGRCNACRWVNEKSKIDWVGRSKELELLVDRHRNSSGEFDCLVPMSGGKDGSYVAYMLKHVYGMNPLAVTVRPALSLEIGDKNLQKLAEYLHSHLDNSTEEIKKEIEEDLKIIISYL